MCDMKTIGIKILVNGIALWLAALAVAGISFGTSTESSSLTKQIGTVIVVAAIFGLVNAFIKPIVKFFTFPFIVLTLGLLSLVINAAMLQLTSWFAGGLHLAFHVDHFFWDAVLGGLIITFVSMILHLLLPDGDKQRA